MKNSIQHIFFDLDHTLWDFEKNSQLAFARIFDANYPHIHLDDFIAAYMPINKACWQLYQVDQMSHDELRYQRLKQSFDALAVAISDHEINQIATDYIHYLPDFNHLFDDAHEVLRYLQSNYHLHIITNGFAEVQYRKMHQSNLTPYFKTITNSELAGAKKPNPIIFEHALQVASATKSNSVMIGDSLDADVLGALDFGMQAVFFNPLNEAVAADICQINQLIDLKNIF
jgi:putative hydrolase of the HAD superfamily